MAKLTVDAPPMFLRFCAVAGIEPTQRQLRKWRRGEGMAREKAEKESGHNRSVRAALKES